MQKNLYYRNVIRRKNVLKTFFLDGFLGIASYPRLLLEVFVRRNFGERYFNMASVLTVAVILALIPMLGGGFAAMRSANAYPYGGQSSGSSFWASYTSWYLFLIAFLYFAWRRSREVKLYCSIFDFQRFSLCSGDIHPFFKSLNLSGKPPSIRQIEIFLEPALFLGIGIVLMLAGQKVGILLTICSLIYSFSYSASYRTGDDFVKDMIDDRILNEEHHNAFVEDMDSSKTRGVRYHMTKPRTREQRMKLTDGFIVNDSNDSDEPVTYAH